MKKSYEKEMFLSGFITEINQRKERLKIQNFLTLLKIMYVTEFIGFGLGSRLDFEKFDTKNQTWLYRPSRITFDWNKFDTKNELEIHLLGGKYGRFLSIIEINKI